MVESNKLSPINQKLPEEIKKVSGLFVYFTGLVRSIYQIWFVVNGNITNGYNPPSLADADAQDNTIYYSTTVSKLVYKDLMGVVHNLY